MAKQLNDKVVIVAGGSTDVGRIIASALAVEGAKVVIADVDARRGMETVEDLKARGAESIFVQADVMKNGDVQDMIEAAVGAFGRLDYTATTQQSVVVPRPRLVRAQEDRPTGRNTSRPA